jgi:hypothetical protein
VDECIIRALRDDHQNADPHHANLCSVCLIAAARLGEPMPTGRHADVCDRAVVYARALNNLGVFDDCFLSQVIEAAEMTRNCTLESGDDGYWFAGWRLRAMLGAGYQALAVSFDEAAYRAICDAVRPPSQSPVWTAEPSAAEQRAADLTASPSRCGLCSRLSSATPRHQHWCRRAGENCPGCMTLGEAHLKSCRFGVLLHHPEDTCCPGVDLPGIGCAHTLGCPVDRPVLRVKVSAAENLCGASESVEALSGGAQCR